MSQQNTSDVILQRRHSGKKPYLVIAVSVGLLYVLQAVLNISLRLSLTCCGGTEMIFNDVTIEEELKNLTDERDELVQKLEQYDMQLTGLRREKDELQTKLNHFDHYLKQNWIHFSGSFYYISTTQKSWQSSRDDCLGRGADLITIDSREENEFARKFEKRLWIGLSDRQSQGNWIWQDGSPLRKSFWQPEEPNSYSGTDEDCVEIGNFDDDNSWNDLVCTEAIFWICEKKTGA